MRALWTVGPYIRGLTGVLREANVGTNFYWLTGRRRAGRSPEEGVHVGKRSGGWSFGFRAWGEGFIYPAWEFTLPDGRSFSSPESQHEPSPFECLIHSRKDWVTKVFSAPGILVSEYGTEEPEVLEWLRVMEGPDEEQIAKERSLDWRGPTGYPILYSAGPRKGEPREWRDEEGFRFYDGEFF